MASKSFFKGKEARNDEAILQALGLQRSMSTWDLTKRILEKAISSRENVLRSEVSYNELRSNHSVLFRRINRLVSVEYIRKDGTRTTKGNIVTLYSLTIKGFIIAASLLEDRDIMKLINVNYDSIAKEISDTSISDTKFLLDLWRNLSGKDKQLFDLFFTSPMNEIRSKYNLPASKEEDLLLYLAEITSRNLLNCLAEDAEPRIRDNLIGILRVDTQLVSEVVSALNWYWTWASADFDTIDSQIHRTFDTVLSSVLKEFKSQSPSETKARDEVLKKLELAKRQETYTRVKPPGPE